MKLLIIVFALVFSEVYGKSGCASFGHSCFGGMGKRAEISDNDEQSPQNSLQDTQNPSYVLTEVANEQMTAGHAVRPSRYNRPILEQLVKEWVINNLRKGEPMEKKK